jgi:hypothetical protein
MHSTLPYLHYILDGIRVIDLDGRHYPCTLIIFLYIIFLFGGTSTCDGRPSRAMAISTNGTPKWRSCVDAPFRSLVDPLHNVSAAYTSHHISSHREILSISLALHA